jgi:hypothetical protein
MQKKLECSSSDNIKSRNKKTRTLNAYEKYATLIFVSFTFREMYCSNALLRRLDFDRWRRSTSVFRRLTTEPLHPAFYFIFKNKPFGTAPFSGVPISVFVKFIFVRQPGPYNSRRLITP